MKNKPVLLTDPVWGPPLTPEQAREATLAMLRASSELPDAPADEEIRRARQLLVPPPQQA